MGKHSRRLFFVLILIGILVLAGCGQKQSNTDNSGSFTIYLAGATPGGGGVWDMIGAGLAEAIMKSNEGSSVTVVPGGGVSDVPIVSNGEAELGLTHSSIAVAALKGIDPFEKKYANLKGVAALYTSSLQFVVNPKLNIESIAAIKENKMPLKIAVGDPGSTGELATKRMFNAYGITYDDIVDWGGKVFYKDMGEAAGMYGDGLIDAFVLLTLAPNGVIQQVATNKEIAFLSVDDLVIDKLETEFGYSATTIPKNTFNFLKNDVRTFSSKVVLVTSDSRSEDEVYRITKGLMENLEYIHSIHHNLKSLTEVDMTQTAIELHPGAAQYYREIGSLK